MNKSIFICLVFAMCCSSVFSLWQWTDPYMCKSNNCYQTIRMCINEGCIGPQCDRCMKDNAECSFCLEMFVDDSNYIQIGNYKYFYCDPKSDNDDACEFQCRRNYFITDVGSLCIRIGNIPVCQCAGWSSTL